MTRDERIVTGLAAAVLAGAYVFLTFPCSRREPGTPRTRSDMTSIQTALVVYRNEFGAWPNGGTADILRALRGENPGKLMFLDVAGQDATLMLDPWGTPYRIGIVSNTITTATAGPNRTWGDHDDMEMRKTERDPTAETPGVVKR